MSLHLEDADGWRTPRMAKAGLASSRAPRGEFVEGWRALIGAFMVNMVGFGAMYSYAAFADDLATAFGESHATSSMVLAVSGASCFAISGITGPLADRVGPRPLAVVGMAAVALGLMAASLARGMIEVVLSYGVMIGVGTGFANVPATVAIQRCFVRNRGLASGIASCGAGVGIALVPLMADLLAAYGDWRFAFAASSVSAGIAGLAGAMLVPGMPVRRGTTTLRAAAEGISAYAASRLASVGAPSRKGFVRLYLGVLMVSVMVVLPFAHLVATARTLGIARADALGLFGLIGIGSIMGRLMLGAVADLAGRRATFLACTITLVMATMLWSQAASFMALTAFAILFGLGWGGFVALLPAFVADQYGVRNVGSAIGLLETGRAIAMLAAPLAVGFAMEAFAGHRVPVAVAGLLGLVGLILIANVPRPRLP